MKYRRQVQLRPDAQVAKLSLAIPQSRVPFLPVLPEQVFSARRTSYPFYFPAAAPSRLLSSLRVRASRFRSAPSFFPWPPASALSFLPLPLPLFSSLPSPQPEPLRLRR